MTGKSEIARRCGKVCGNGIYVEGDFGRLPIWRTSEEAEKPLLPDGTKISFYPKTVCGEDRAAGVRDVHTEPTKYHGPPEKRVSLK